MNRRGWTFVEVLVALGLFLLLLVLVVWLFSFGSRTLARLMPGLDLQKTNRRAVVRLIGEMQEGMELIAPVPGATLSYAVIADRTGQIKFFNQRGNVLWVDAPDSKRHEKLFDGIQRLTFTSLGEGAVLVNLLLTQDGAESPVLTTIRLRNLAAAEEVW